MSTASRGSSRERQVRKQLESEGWAVTRGAGSHGCADLWAAKQEIRPLRALNMRFVDSLMTTLRLIQVKTDKDSPWANFRPADRVELLALAAQTGGSAELWHWPANKPCRIYRPDEWPVAR